MGKMYVALGEAALKQGRPTLDIDQRLELIKRVESGVEGLQSLMKGRQPAMTKKPETYRKRIPKRQKKSCIKNWNI